MVRSPFVALCTEDARRRWLVTTESDTSVWITNASPNIEAVVNPVIAACDDGFVPDHVHLLGNPSVEDAGEEALGLVDETITTYEGDASLDAEMLADERDFEAIVEFYRRTLEDTPDDAAVAVDVTPGRKFMSALAFQAGMRYGADHVFYLYLYSNAYYDRLYPEIPTTGVDLMDFTGVFS